MNIMPTIDVPQVQIKEMKRDEKYMPSIRFDFDAGDFVTAPRGQLVPSSGRDAYIQWCQKQMLTERYSHSAYSEDIGVEIEDAMKELTPDAVLSAIERTITEAILVNAHTEFISDFVFVRHKNGVIHVTASVKGKNMEEAQIAADIAVFI